MYAEQPFCFFSEPNNGKSCLSKKRFFNVFTKHTPHNAHNGNINIEIEIRRHAKMPCFTKLEYLLHNDLRHMQLSNKTAQRVNQIQQKNQFFSKNTKNEPHRVAHATSSSAHFETKRIFVLGASANVTGFVAQRTRPYWRNSYALLRLSEPFIKTWNARFLRHRR